MKVSTVSFVAFAALTLAEPIPGSKAKRQSAWDWPEGYGPPAYIPPSYDSPDFITTPTTRAPLSTAPANSTFLGSPIGLTNSSSIPGSTGFNPSFTSKPRTGIYTNSSSASTVTLTSQITLTTTVSRGTGVSSGLPIFPTPSHNYTWSATRPIGTGSPVNASSRSFSSHPWYTNSTSALPGPTGTGSLILTTGLTLTSTSTIQTTITLSSNSTSTSRTRIWSLTGSAPLSTGGSSIADPIGASSRAPYTNISATALPVYPTAYYPDPHPTNTRSLTWGAPSGHHSPDTAPTFSSDSRLPGPLSSSTSSITNLETFPTFGPDPTTFSTKTRSSKGIVTKTRGGPEGYETGKGEGKGKGEEKEEEEEHGEDEDEDEDDSKGGRGRKDEGDDDELDDDEDNEEYGEGKDGDDDEDKGNDKGKGGAENDDNDNDDEEGQGKGGRAEKDNGKAEDEEGEEEEGNRRGE